MKRTPNLIAVAFLSLFVLGLLSCAAQPEQPAQSEQPAPPAAETGTAIAKAVCVLHATEGNQAHGTVTFIQEGGQVKVVADVQGMNPGKHGFHIHEFGDCSAPDGSSAGGHFSPDGKAHGAPTDSERHVGDLGNIEGGPDGMAHLEWTDSLLSLGGPHSIIGRGVIVHAGEDDLKTQPTGNAGARVACGVIGVAK